MTSPQLAWYRRKAEDPAWKAEAAARQADRRKAETPEQRAARLASIARCRRKRNAEQRAADTASAKRSAGARRAKMAELKARPCADCGMSYPAHVMQFDHRPGEPKVSDVSAMVSRRWDLVLAEVAKCDVVCANCHAERTHQRRK